VADDHEAGGHDAQRAAYQALRRTFLQLVPAGIFWADATGACQYVNQQFCDITGHTSEQLLGYAYRDCIHPDDRDRLFPEFQSAVEAGVLADGQLRFPNAGRTDVWAAVRVAAVEVEGQVLGYLATVQDLTHEIESEQARKENEALLEAISDRAPIGIMLVDNDGFARSANPRAVEILGQDPIGLNLVDFVLPEDLDIAVTTSVEAIARRQADYGFSVRFVRPDGSVRHADVHAQAMMDDNHQILNSVIAVIDNTEAVEARRESERYAELLAALTDFVALCDPSGRVTYLNRVAEINARDLPLVGVRRLSDFFDNTSRGRLASDAWPEVITNGFWQGELTMAFAPGIVTPVSVSLATHLHADGERTVSVVARDISDIKAAQRALEVQATHDPLTGLPNRALLFDRVGHALERAQRGEHRIALMFVDLDGFKAVNDLHGHDAGDEVLRGVGSRLLDVVRGGDTVARIGGDEFVVLCEGLGDPAIAGRIAERMIEHIHEPFAVAGALAGVGASIGIAYASPQSTVSGLVKQADLAVYEAKRTGKGRVVVFEESMRRTA
jgi:diguanylate cyclase (GGDEF)-like protein/PAS domain S-box-containing protein